MRALIIVVLTLASVSCRSAAQDGWPDVVAMERAALDRWGKGDPQGYLGIMADEVTYFDPTQEKRVDGGEAMKRLLIPFTGTIKVARFDMIDPTVQRHGDAAVSVRSVTLTPRTDSREGRSHRRITRSHRPAATIAPTR